MSDYIDVFDIIPDREAGEDVFTPARPTDPGGGTEGTVYALAPTGAIIMFTQFDGVAFSPPKVLGLRP